MNRKRLPVLLLFLLVVAIPLTVFLSQQVQEIRQRAAEPSLDPMIEGFESGNLTGWTPVTETGTSVTVTQAAALTGSYGLHVAVPGGDDGRITKTFPNSPQLYTRIKMKILRDITPRFGQQFFMIGQGGYTGGVSMHLRSDNGYINRLQGYNPGGQLFDTGISLTPNQWYTFEVYVEPGLQGKLQIWLDGAATPIVNQTGSWTSTPLSLISIGSDGGSSGNEYYFDDFAMSNATKIGTGVPQFGLGPLRSDGAPSGGLPETTTSTQLSVKTATNATCKYGTNNNIDFDQYQNMFSQTGGTTHTQSVSGLVKGNSYKYYVRCRDASGVKNMDDYLIYFTIPFGSLQIDQATSVTLIPNYETMSVYGKFVGDANKNASAQIFYRESGQSTWKKGMKMTPERRENIPVEFTNQFKGSIFGLLPKRDYDVQVRFDDPDGVNGQPQQFSVTKSTATRDDNPPLGTVQSTPSTTSLNITTSGTADNWRTYMPPSGQKSVISGTLTINANYIRVKGFEITGNIVINSTASNVIIEDNTFLIDTQNVIRQGGAYSGTRSISENITVQRNTFTKTSTNIAKKFVDFVNNTKGGHVIRQNTFKDLSGVQRVSGQYWDCIGGAPNFELYGFVHRDSDINDNYFEGCNDDQVEADGGNMNVRIWNNTFFGATNALQTMSVDPTLLGPLYVVRNVSYGNHQAGFAKLGSDSTGPIYFYHNTHYNTPVGGGFKYANPVQQRVTSRNNIMHVVRYAIELTDGGATHSFDYDNLYATDTSRFVKWDGNSTYTTLTKFQTIMQKTDGFGNDISSQNISQEKNGYNFDMVNDRLNGFVNPAGNDLRLLTTSALIDKGVIIDGINNADSPWPYLGNGPDIGKYESGATGTPNTPTPTNSGVSPTPTRTPTLAPPTSTPTRTPTPTQPTVTTNPSPVGTSIPLVIKLHGIGTGGDVVNPNSQGNMTPLRTTRQVSVEVYSALNNQFVGTANGTITYSSITGEFTGSALTTTVLPQSGYNLRITSPGYLTSQLLGISLPGVTTQRIALVAGDINNDKSLDILDYNLLVSCYGADSTTVPTTCSGQNVNTADLYDDGNVNFIDLNLWLREFSKKS